MKYFIDISPYWPQERSILSVQQEWIAKGFIVDRKALTSAVKGKLFRCDIKTLVNLLEGVNYLTGDRGTIKFEDILKVQE